jgi:hypothetical protein
VQKAHVQTLSPSIEEDKRPSMPRPKLEHVLFQVKHVLFRAESQGP